MDDTRQKLIDVAGQLFSEKGFEATTVREVCQLAGVNIAAIHYHFGDKERLYIEAVKYAHCQQGVIQFEWPPGLTPEQKLGGMIAHMVQMMLAEDAPSWHIELMMRELARPTRACQALVEEFISPMFAQLLAIVSEFLPDESPLILRQQLAFSVVAQCLLYRYHRPIGRLLVGEETFRKMTEVEQAARQITAFSIGGIRAAVFALDSGTGREDEAPAVNRIEVIVEHASDVPVPRRSCHSATETPPAEHRSAQGNPPESVFPHAECESRSDIAYEVPR